MRVTPFAREVKRLRGDRGVTIRELAATVHKSVAYLAKIEAQGEIPTPDVTIGIARALDANPADLLRLASECRIAASARAIRAEYQSALDNHSTVAASEAGNGGRRMASAVSMINMKGGVGKTTLTMQLAHIADAMDLRTLAVDLDPQANLSQALLGPKAYVDHIEAHRPTVVQIFDGYVPSGGHNGSPAVLEVDDVIVKKAGYWRNSTLDLIPSRLELSRVLKNPTGKERRLAKALARVGADYDLILIDCAPTESILTDAAYFASRYVIVPIKPEFMATIGLPLLARSIQEFSLENDDHRIEIAGLVFNHSSAYSSGPEGQQAIREVSDFAAEQGWYICENQVRYSATYAKAARERAPLSQTSYARTEVVNEFRSLADELFGLVQLNQTPV